MRLGTGVVYGAFVAAVVTMVSLLAWAVHFRISISGVHTWTHPIWGSHDPAWLGGAERNPLKNSHLALLWTPRARATEPGRRPHRSVPADPLRAPQSRAREKPVAAGGKRVTTQNKCFI